MTVPGRTVVGHLHYGAVWVAGQETSRERCKSECTKWWADGPFYTQKNSTQTMVRVITSRNDNIHVMRLSSGVCFKWTAIAGATLFAIGECIKS